MISLKHSPTIRGSILTLKYIPPTVYLNFLLYCNLKGPGSYKNSPLQKNISGLFFIIPKKAHNCKIRKSFLESIKRQKKK
jgi:hypothetical protein